MRLVIQLVAHRKCGGEATREIGTDARSRWSRYKYRTMANEEGSVGIAGLRVPRLIEVIRRLRERPDVVLGDQAEGRCVCSATVSGGGCRIAFPVVVPLLSIVDLVVEGTRLVVPHLHQPTDAKICFVGEIG